jgi:aminopeptidase
MTDADLPFDLTKLDQLAEVIVRVGLNLQPGQNLLISAPVEALPLVRRVAAAAYRAGAGVVTPLLSDEEVTLARYRHGQDASFDAAAGWLFRGMAEAYDEGAARLAISADNPMLLKGQDPAKVARANKATSIASRPAMEKITGFETNWCVASYPGRAWARQVFAGIPEDEAVGKLAEAIFAASRLNNNDPVAEWSAHDARLQKRMKWLDDQRFSALHFRAPGTDLKVGLADNHSWKGGTGVTKTGITCLANIPTEEVFTTPHAQRVDGTARASKPLVHQGTLIENIEVRFEAGRIVEARASSGEEVLQKLLDTDEGARRLGEVALVPHSSPISHSGLLFFNTLFDENAACHIALGQCYSECFTDEVAADNAAIAASGGNSSLIHVDWMIGSGQTDIDGIRADGTVVPVFRKGEWA